MKYILLYGFTKNLTTTISHLAPVMLKAAAMASSAYALPSPPPRSVVRQSPHSGGSGPNLLKRYDGSDGAMPYACCCAVCSSVVAHHGRQLAGVERLKLLAGWRVAI